MVKAMVLRISFPEDAPCTDRRTSTGIAFLLAASTKSSRNQKGGTAEQMGQGDRPKCDWSVLVVDRRQVEVDPIPTLHCHAQEGDLRGKESQSKTSTSSEPLSGVPNAIKFGKRAQGPSDRFRAMEANHSFGALATASCGATFRYARSASHGEAH